MNLELDIGPLSWVKEEIELALGRAAELLQKYATHQDAALLAGVRTHLHQAHGALAVVGLDGITEFARAIERLLDALAQGAASWSPALGEAAQEGIASLRQYLDELIAGLPDQALRLLPVYRRLNAASGTQETAAADLFFPDLTQRPPKRAAGSTQLDEQARQARLRAARLGFERGRAKWLKQDASGIRDMRNSTAMIETLQEQPAARAFWWVTLAWFDALALGGIADDDAARRLCGHIDEQVRLLRDGAQAVPERLMRDVLYDVAMAAVSNERIDLVRAAYRLRELVPVEATAGDPREAALREMRERLGSSVDDWDQFCAGAAIALPRFHEQSAQLLTLAQQLGHVDLARLVAALANAANLLRKNPLLHSDALAGEVATALLLTENAVNRFDALDGGFVAQVDALTGRLNALQRGETLPSHELPALQALAQRAGNRSVLRQRGRDLRDDLRQVERALDVFFRDSAKAEALAGVAQTLQQIAGVFEQLGQPRAVQVTQECARRIGTFLVPGHERQPGEFEEVARKISALDFFVEQLQRGPTDLDALLAPPPLSTSGSETAPAPAAAGIPGGAVAAESVTNEAARLAHANAEEVDNELLAVFIEEAAQALDTIGIQLGGSMTSPANPEPLSILRRCFHTLKGSSSMVGLMDFGETAHAVETVLERHLQSGGPATPELHEMVDTARHVVSDWIGNLQRGAGTPDTTSLLRQCEAIRQQPAQHAEAVRTKPPAVADMEQTRAKSQTLLPVFLEECADLIPAVAAGFSCWRNEGKSGAESLQRILHTIKGSARMAGAVDIGETIHNIETRIAAAQATAVVTPELIDELETGFDRIVNRIGALRAAPEAGAEAPQPMLRVPAGLVDTMVNEAGEIAIARAHIEGSAKSLRASLGDLTENVARLRTHLRELEIQAESRIQSNAQSHGSEESIQEFDPLEMDRFTRMQELTRILAEDVNDVATVEHGLLHDLDQVDAALTQQARLARELAQQLMGVRMVPFSTIAERLRRVLRMTAGEAGKKIGLVIEGGAVELDRSVLERVTGPLEHLLRNAVVHGIETGDQRAAAGKPAQGEVRLALLQAGNEVQISVGDDGRGLDYPCIRDEAVKRGLLGADQETSEAQLEQLIYRPGFTTVTRLSESAGRGVGLDVVKSEIAAMGGHVDVRAQAGRGTTFSLHLPLTQAVLPVVLVKSGRRTFAIPASMVVQASDMKAEAMVQLRSAAELEWQGQRLALHYLPRLLGDSATQPLLQHRHWVLVLRGGVQQIALEVDALVGNEEVVIKNIGPQLAHVPGISGATVLSHGEVVLIVNPLLLVNAQLAQTQPRAPVPVAEPAPAALPPLVMVVDDSLTVRKITGRLLDRAGYRVMTAKDGVDTLEQLAEAVPAVMLLDIEMPRMDGFELLRRLRADARFKSLPVIMITSRIADKHRNYALELGVNNYLGKPYDEAELLAMIAGFIAR
ncbi:Hybrid sensor histidine kinase/response regulator [Georgfuchsia toluolica]|uniref:Chemotaxis protein CheA n=1 Tax=Georgfuchsia toluolica TaxID=424218 RepID=A0A916N2Z6_9PROT|nr:Hpt domain-containing protein [Georgfuchsia toluolica]CAG4884454.1 Hybrid sensor histidine kinase/response regulator [Georgfuchsia toluolica]